MTNSLDFKLQYNSKCSIKTFYRTRVNVNFSRLSEIPRELFVLDQERKKIESEHQSKLNISNQKLTEAQSQEAAILNEMDKTGQGECFLKIKNITFV